MKKRFVAINVLRWTTFFGSLGAFGCHMLQCILLLKYQQLAEIDNWLQAGHWQYLTWFIVLGLSMLCSLAILVLAFYFDLSTMVKTDKILAAFNVIPLLTSIVTTILFDNNEPWSGGKVATKRPLVVDLFEYCAQLDSAVDAFHPLLFQRCLLSDLTWLLACVLCVLWISLLIMASTLPRALTAATVLPSHEPAWGRYVPDPFLPNHCDSSLASTFAPPNAHHHYGGATHVRPLSHHASVKKTNSAMLLNAADLQRHASYHRYSAPVKSPSMYAAPRSPPAAHASPAPQTPAPIPPPPSPAPAQYHFQQIGPCPPHSPFQPNMAFPEKLELNDQYYASHQQH
ncbi:hypothetical protein BC940DRAFT_336786 [Gongronella butleri]|nr:hypothetical protein BC940DRAFT_336786 [Gongronella butleri]